MKRTKYNHCKSCQKWLGWANYCQFWKAQKLCEECQIQAGIF